MKIIYLNCGIKNYLKEDIAAIYTTYAAEKRKPEKNSGFLFATA